MDERLTGWLLAVVVLVVSLGWLMTFVILPWIRPGFHAAPEVNIALMAVIGLFLRAWQKAKKPDDASPDKEDEP